MSLHPKAVSILKPYSPDPTLRLFPFGRTKVAVVLAGIVMFHIILLPSRSQ